MFIAFYVYKLLSFLYRYKLMCINKWISYTYTYLFVYIRTDIRMKIVKDETMSEFRNGVEDYERIDLSFSIFLIQHT